MIPLHWRTFRLVLLLFIVWLLAAPAAPAVQGADLAIPPAPVPAPSSPSLLPPYAVWESTPIPEAGAVAGFDMAIGDDGRMHFAIAEARTGALVYMVGTPGAWITSTVAVSPTIHFLFPSIALDSNDAPHIAYLEYGNCTEDAGSAFGLRSVRYTALSTGGWTIVELHPGPDPVPCEGTVRLERKTDLALDGDDRPWIIWIEESLDPVPGTETARLAMLTPGDVWGFVTLIRGDYVDARLATAPDGNIHSAYAASGGSGSIRRADLWHHLWYSGGVGGAPPTRLGPAQTFAGYTEVAVDPLGRVFVTGNDTSFAEATLWRGDGAAWVSNSLTTVDNINDVAMANALAISAEGLPALTMFRSESSDGRGGMYFYWWDGFGWRNERFDTDYSLLSFHFDGNDPVVGYLKPGAATLNLMRRVPVELEPRAWLPLTLH